ncbi:hypothetical protein [Arthrobacter sp. SO3]|uniref:hypothetical protein n=1 Tax=Arthrobacter sp. SO3 TaxID=1897057 RepID=UPI001CFF6A00|nr:hypothetical protein [Arthrobacter sp. SO3]MCB5291293.1 hypothetical protein [Arthrobacter sp. SO3]
MRRVIATLGVVGLGMMTAAVSANAAPPAEKKITICHATSSAENPFVPVTIDLSALKAHADDTLDIVPANDGDLFPGGLNLSTANLAFLANGCASVVVPPVDHTPDPVDETPGPVDETPGPVDETPAETTPVSDVTPPAAVVVAPKAAAAVVKKTNVGYNVQTAVDRTADTGIPAWLLALTGVLTAGAATVLWRSGRLARTTEN